MARLSLLYRLPRGINRYTRSKPVVRVPLGVTSAAACENICRMNRLPAIGFQPGEPLKQALSSCSSSFTEPRASRLFPKLESPASSAILSAESSCLRFMVRSILKVRTKLLSDGRKTLLHRPQRHLRQDRRGQKMHVHPRETPTHQTARGDEREHLVIARCGHARQRGEGIEKLLSLGQVTAGQLANDEVVRADLGLLKEFDERGISPAQMIHPDGGINEHRRLASGPRPPARNRD